VPDLDYYCFVVVEAAADLNNIASLTEIGKMEKRQTRVISYLADIDYYY
jgi:hypothetical protein